MTLIARPVPKSWCAAPTLRSSFSTARVTCPTSPASPGRSYRQRTSRADGHATSSIRRWMEPVNWRSRETSSERATKITRQEMLPRLLKAGAKVMPRDEDGKTPLDLALSSAMIELLKAYGAREQ